MSCQIPLLLEGSEITSSIDSLWQGRAYVTLHFKSNAIGVEVIDGMFAVQSN